MNSIQLLLETSSHDGHLGWTNSMWLWPYLKNVVHIYMYNLILSPIFSPTDPQSSSFIDSPKRVPIVVMPNLTMIQHTVQLEITKETLARNQSPLLFLSFPARATRYSDTLYIYIIYMCILKNIYPFFINIPCSWLQKSTLGPLLGGLLYIVALYNSIILQD